ncbi:hypothetical protein PMG71_12490 [Roseofilum sp. BLCC_M154]|uniref:Peptidase C-terminal archaeal/bacterial domain-containing protein n=1 Tax=Roseofilum acuticapitatum BLCC-M154 TaxID=3022444 RepID=A0ABT7ATM4_9CYAN|nr:hypothetical protein [Roseofilum acuticapitatum]MDJ1170250.1 hypothetical protein [Roseofilum acuticapitatum BLCC-M154]
MRVNHTGKVAVGLLVSTSLLIPTVAIADYYEDQINTLLMGTAEEVGLYELVSGPYIGSVDASSSTDITLNLRKGQDYTILGVCDEDCDDLDLEIYNLAGNPVEADTLGDDYPIVRISPNRTGGYRLKVDMYSCSTSFCYYGIGVFRE